MAKKRADLTGGGGDVTAAEQCHVELELRKNKKFALYACSVEFE